MTQTRTIFRMERPVPPSPAGRRLRWLIGVTALSVIAVETINYYAVPEPGFSLFVRSVYALVRIIGFLFLMRAVRYGRAGARPFGLILAVTTIFAVARLVEPREGKLEIPTEVIVSFGLLTVLCGAIVWMLYRSPGVHLHLSGRQVRRHIPPWVLTVRVAVLAYSALLIVPLLVAFGTLFDGERRLPLAPTVYLLVIWGALAAVVMFVVPWIALFVLVGHGWARWALGVVSVVVLFAQPALCYALEGPEGLLRDGVPMIITALFGLYALYRSRGLETWVRPNNGTPPVANGDGRTA